MKRVIAVVAALLGASGAAGKAQAVSDIGLTSSTPHAVRVLPAQSGSVSITVTNHGPDAVAPTIESTSIYYLFHGFTMTLPEPACGVLTKVGLGDYYSIALPSIEAGASATCTIDIARDTSAFAASDLPLVWTVAGPGDPDPSNDAVDFQVGSLIDMSVSIVPVSFEIDGGVAHAVNRLVVENHGPSNVMGFVVGACTDHGPPAFIMDAGYDGGCGTSQYSPGCFDSGFGFGMPAMAPGEAYSCTIALTGTAPYEDPVRWHVGTALLANPDTLGGTLLDTAQADNGADLVLGPAPGVVFADGFDH